MTPTKEQLDQEMREWADGEVRRMKAEHQALMRWAVPRLVAVGLLVVAIAVLEYFGWGLA